MLRTWRRRLRLIRYYSAARPRTIWSRATDIALLAAVAVAPLFAWVMNTAVTDVWVRTELFGRTMIDIHGRSLADIVPADQLTAPWLGGVTPVSEFHIITRVEDRGWPITTSRIEHAPVLELTLILERTTRVVPSDTETDELAAIEQALRERDYGPIVEHWRAATARRQTYVLGWVFSSLLWCVMLWAALLVVINLARLAAWLGSARKHVRGARLRGQNRCANCGYDLRGLEFNERCPECGHLSW